MANIQNQIDEIATAFYGSQVRGAIVEGLQSINDEVNSLNTNITEVDSKTEKMDAIVNTSTEKIQELIGEYNNINTEAQEKFKQIDGALSNVLVNSKITNPTIIGTVTNTSTFEGGTFENCSIESPTISNASLDGSVTLIGGTGIQGGAITNTTLSGTIKNISQINGGTYDNPTFIGASIENKGTFNGGTYENGVFNQGEIWNTELGNCTTIDGFTVNGGMQACGNDVTQYYSTTHNQTIAPGVNAVCDISWFLFNAPLLTGNKINGSTGIITLTLTLDNTYNWGKWSEEIGISEMPASSARTISPTAYFGVGTSAGTIYISGQGMTLEAGKPYTTQAMMWQ